MKQKYILIGVILATVIGGIIIFNIANSNPQNTEKPKDDGIVSVEDQKEEIMNEVIDSTGMTPIEEQQMVENFLFYSEVERDFQRKHKDAKEQYRYDEKALATVDLEKVTQELKEGYKKIYNPKSISFNKEDKDLIVDLFYKSQILIYMESNEEAKALGENMKYFILGTLGARNSENGELQESIAFLNEKLK